MEGGQGADKQQLEGEEGGAYVLVEEGKRKESARDLPDRSRWTKEENVRRSEQDRSDKEELER
jgi:hypothetical protein